MDGLTAHVPTEISAPDSDGRLGVSITPAAVGVLLAWEGDQQLRALHEAAHGVAATVLGIGASTLDIKPRAGGCSILNVHNDDEPSIVRASVHADRIVVALAAAAAERLILGEVTDGNGYDIRHATHMAVERFSTGMDPDAPAGGIALDSIHGAPESARELMAASILRTMAAARERADTLVAENREAIICLARSLYGARRLSDGELANALREAGLEPILRGGQSSRSGPAKS
jgi:ATP-dependent Zn protease